MKGPIVIKWSVYKIREVDIIEGRDVIDRRCERTAWCETPVG